MKIISDFLALILFFLAYFLSRDIFIATAVAVVIGVIQAVFIWFKSRKLEPLQWISLLLIVILGGLTIILKNDAFIKWKPSLLFWSMAGTILIGLLLKKNALKKLLGKEISLPDHVWHNLSIAWIVFFIIMGMINIFVATHYSRDTWVAYKTFGSMGLMVVFFIIQGVYMAKYLPKDQHKS